MYCEAIEIFGGAAPTANTIHPLQPDEKLTFEKR
jgi:hypothetical protein